MSGVPNLAVALLLLAMLSAAQAEEEPAPSSSADVVSAPVVYKELMLVVSDELGVAAFIFTGEIADGVKYRYRYLPKHGAEESGEGKVFEKYKRLPGDKPGDTVVVNDGGQLFLKAGQSKMEWSYGGKGRGHIYYRPEQVRVQIANAENFEKIDLKRFSGVMPTNQALRLPSNAPHVTSRPSRPAGARCCSCGRQSHPCCPTPTRPRHGHCACR